MYKFSEQQIDPKVLSVSNSCGYDENFKNGSKQQLFTDKCPQFWTYSNKSSPPGQKLGCEAPEWGQIFGANPGGALGVAMAGIDRMIVY